MAILLKYGALTDVLIRMKVFIFPGVWKGSIFLTFSRNAKISISSYEIVRCKTLS